jgi:hypothetical protein
MSSTLVMRMSLGLRGSLGLCGCSGVRIGCVLGMSLLCMLSVLRVLSLEVSLMRGHGLRMRLLGWMLTGLRLRSLRMLSMLSTGSTGLLLLSGGVLSLRGSVSLLGCVLLGVVLLIPCESSCWENIAFNEYV